MTYTRWGYIINLPEVIKIEEKKYTHRTDEEKNYLIKRLNIIEGQIKGIKQMIDSDRYCDDVLTQLLAVNKSIESLENNILESHLKKCIKRQIEEGKIEVTDEIMGLFKKFR